MTCFAYVLLITGGITILANVFSLFMIDSFTKFSWTDRNGEFNSISVNKCYMFMMILFKIASAVLQVGQGKGMLYIFQAILKEYRDAESGVTAGIQMTKRKTRDMHVLKRQIRYIGVAFTLIVFITLIMTKKEANKIADDLIEKQYAKTNGFKDFGRGLDQFMQEIDEDEDFPPFFDEDDDFGPMIDDEMMDGRGDHDYWWDDKDSDDDMSEINVQSSKFDDLPMPPMPELTYSERSYEGRPKHHKEGKEHNRHGDKIKKMARKWMRGHDFDNMSLQQAKDLAHYVLACVMIFVFIYACICIWIFQGILLCCISKAMNHQSKLEHHILGPDPNPMPCGIKFEGMCQSPCRRYDPAPQPVQVHYAVATAPPAPAQTGHIATASNQMA